MITIKLFLAKFTTEEINIKSLLSFPSTKMNTHFPFYMFLRFT